MKQIPRISALLVTGLLASQLGYAADLYPGHIAPRCLEIASQLKRFADSNQGSVCRGDIEIASAYVEAAGNELYQEKNELALRSMTYAQHELKEITSTRAYCMRLAPEAKLFLALVITLKSEIEIMGLKAS